MAKPSVTNIRAPSKTSVWTPPKTVWDLNDSSQWTDPYFGWNTADDSYYDEQNISTGNTNFAGLVDQINLISLLEQTDITKDDLVNLYDYVFLGVNGGEDETVTGITGAAGIIATGNGKDNVTGGEVNDLVFTGNGMDTVHGGGGDDIIFGENGTDSLNGDANNDWIYGGEGDDTIAGGTDDGDFSYEEVPGGTVLTLKDNQHIDDTVFSSDIGGTFDGTGTNNNNLVREGVYVAVDGDGHPTELDGDGDPIVHVIYSFSPTATGNYTFAYISGNNLDGIGEPDPDQFSATGLVAGNKYYYSFTNSDGGSLSVAVFSGSITVTNPINDGPGGNPASVDTLSVNAPDWHSYFEETTSEPEVIFTFTAGDHLTGGAGSDTFVYQAGDGVDEILDYHRADLVDVSQDIVKLVGFTEDDVTVIEKDGDSYILFNDGEGGYQEDAAIKIVGVSDFTVDEITFA
jgi:hemolysin type calcium-binding protein